MSSSDRTTSFDAVLIKFIDFNPFGVIFIEFLSDGLKGIAFFNWDQFAPFADHILAVYSEFNERLREMKFDHPRLKPDDFLHTGVYALLVSQFDHPRPDLHAPEPGGSRKN